MASNSDHLEQLVRASTPYSKSDILAKPCPIPADSGVYAWFFDQVPNAVPVDGLLLSDALTLLYVGISPNPPSPSGAMSSQTVRSRIRYHFSGNAYGSTLRKTLGCLLSEQLGIHLQRVGISNTRITFGDAGEKALSTWMADHARVAWLIHLEPWVIEDEAIERLNLPLNLKGNESNPFHPELTRIMKRAMDEARG